MIRNNYNTKQKNNILNFFKNNEANLFFAKDINNIFKNNDNKIGLTTIYRLLDSLVKDNVITIFYGDFGKKYGYFPCNNTNHYHLICNACGKIEHIECDQFSKLSNHLNTNHNFLLNEKEIFLKGRCKKCY